MRFILAILAIMGFVAPVHAGDKADWVSLFNGKDLDGWDTWLGKPYMGKEVVGLNTDPHKVYSIVEADGKPALRISGEIWGALTSKQEFENYALKLEFKWGEKKWPPRDKTVRDSGLLYHCVGKHGAQGTFWMRSQELQIQEHDCGDYWSVAGAIVDVEGEQKIDKNGKKGAIVFKRGGQQFTGVKSRIIRNPENDKLEGWNTIELIAVGGTCIHIVNGKVNMIMTNSRQLVDGKEVPLTRGKIQIQSEGAEVFYRDIAARKMTTIPDNLLK